MLRLELNHAKGTYVAVDEYSIPVAIWSNGKVLFWLYDVVRVKPDQNGFICDGITHEGIGTIVRIRRDEAEQFFGVLTTDREFGYVEASKIEKI